jgi:peroxisome-assembly ATPase
MSATALSITNPLVKYRALVATKQVLPDQAQFRLALHLQKLYDRLKDYEPQIEYSTKLDQISRAVNSRRHVSPDPAQDDPTPALTSTWRTLLAAKETRDSLALTRRLTNHESAMQMSSPKGLMLHGEVGTGKSMLIDLFADCLPNRKKRRWHFNTFMLETFAKLEALRRSRQLNRAVPSVIGDEDDYSLLWLAKDMIQTSPILFLDEFQMPDRVASKILTNLMTSFFHLGGVLVATSNRMPEELAKAAGEDFPMPAPSRLDALGWQFGAKRKSNSDKLFGGQNEFAAFLEVLKARCEVWEMGAAKDYRRLEGSGGIRPAKTEGDDEGQMDHLGNAVDELPEQAVETTADQSAGEAPQLPTYYTSLTDLDSRNILEKAILQAGGQPLVESIPWAPAVLKVYGRLIPVPRTYNGITKWTFEELCKTTLGPADYITLASTYHTVILTDVPVLTWLMKNEARRFITVLDALYECKCKLFISAAAGPDDLFFPEKKSAAQDDDTGDSVYSETISEVYQDATAPFRPNILMDNPNYAEPDAEPDYTHARLAGLLNADQLEDDPPNKARSKSSHPFGRSFGRTDSEMERPPVDPDEVRYTGGGRRPLDFGKTSAFTGEDERFAYKRAQSRLWEMCGSRWWSRNEEGWHRPLPQEVRRWEKTVEEQTAFDLQNQEAHPAIDVSDVVMGESKLDNTRPEESFKHSVSSPFRTSREPPPKFSWTHVWGTMKWGPKAGAWGQGVDGLEDRGKEKR